MALPETPHFDDPDQELAQWLRRRRRHHWLVLGLSAAVLVTAWLFEVRQGDVVALSGTGVELPASCWWKRLGDWQCPGCGMTRAMVALASGDWLAGWRYNAAGPMLFVALLYQMPYRAAQLRRLARGDEEWDLPGGGVLLALFLALLLGQWAWRLVW